MRGVECFMELPRLFLRLYINAGVIVVWLFGISLYLNVGVAESGLRNSLTLMLELIILRCFNV